MCEGPLMKRPLARSGTSTGDTMSETVDRVGVFAQVAVAISAVIYPIVRLIDQRLERRRRELEKRCEELEERLDRLERLDYRPRRAA
jgi:hypothetical protein